MIDAPAGFFEWLMTEDGYLLREDTLAWSAWYKRFERETVQDSFLAVFSGSDLFRKIFDYRVQSSAAGQRFGAMRRDLPRFDGLSINCPKIGPRLRIQHGSSTYIFAREIGADFWINQNATVGSNGRGTPLIGNQVRVLTGAVVVGEISIGDRVNITANAVVNFDVPSDSAVYAARSIVKPRRR